MNALIEQLKAQQSLTGVSVDDVIKELERAERRVQFTDEWYAVRFERLEKLCKEVGIWEQAAAVIANGMVNSQDPPTFAQLLNRTNHRRERAERDLEAIKKQWHALRTAWANISPEIKSLLEQSTPEFIILLDTPPVQEM